jgi:DNA-binding LacI/PurR family transcriptional regulator
MGIFGPICNEIACESQRRGFHILWAQAGRQTTCQDQHPLEQFCRQCAEQKVAGVFFAPEEFTPGMEEANRQAAETLDRAGVAVVLLDRDLHRFPDRSKFDVVGVDNYRVGYLQTEHLLRLGCRHIEHLAIPLSAPTIDARTDGYRQAFRLRGLRCPESWVRRGDPAEVAFVKRITRKMPDAFVCGNDWTAATLLRSLQSLGIRVPQDVRIVSVDDDEYARLLSTPLTTVRQPSREIGAAAVGAMIERIENRDMPARNIMLDCKLIVRESCGGRIGLSPNMPATGVA